jgi:hypothetical protein
VLTGAVRASYDISTTFFRELPPLTIETLYPRTLIDDVFWILKDKDGGTFCVSNRAEGIQDLVSALGTLPGYNHERTVAAIEDQGCCDNKVVTVWSAENKT